MKLRFTKMHGLGNDFVMIDTISQKITLSPERVQHMADRHFGIGCDQILVVEPPQHSDMDFKYRIFNQDGSEVENCGNGARCFAVFVRQRKLTGKRTIKAETLGGPLELSVLNDNQVTVNMGIPKLEPREVPFTADHRAITYSLPVANTHFDISAVSMGNPHAVTFVEDVQLFPVGNWGAQIENHPLFPNKVNAGFAQYISANHIRLRVFERGVGETLACGTGACAAVVAGRLRQKLDEVVEVQMGAGSLSIRWQGEGHPVWMTGPVTTVFHGQINI